MRRIVEIYEAHSAEEANQKPGMAITFRIRHP